MIKVLEAYCKAKGYQGATIWQVLEDCSIFNPTIDRKSDPYKWGYREGQAQSHGSFLGDYPVPVNSWSPTNNESTLEYLAGINAGMLDCYTFNKS